MKKYAVNVGAPYRGGPHGEYQRDSIFAINATREVMEMFRAEMLTEIKEGTPEYIILNAAIFKMEHYVASFSKLKDTPENHQMLSSAFYKIAEEEYLNTRFINPFARGIEVDCNKITRDIIIRERG
jgi:hypothetical protein